MLWSWLESLDHVYYLIVFLSSCNAVLWIIVGTRFVGFLAHNEMKWILNSFSADLYPPAFSRDIYETFLVFEQHEVWWYRRCIEKQSNATKEIHPIVLHLLHFDCKVSFNYLVSDSSPVCGRKSRHQDLPRRWIQSFDHSVPKWILVLVYLSFLSQCHLLCL